MIFSTVINFAGIAVLAYYIGSSAIGTDHAYRISVALHTERPDAPLGWLDKAMLFFAFFYTCFVLVSGLEASVTFLSDRVVNETGDSELYVFASAVAIPMTFLGFLALTKFPLLVVTARRYRRAAALYEEIFTEQSGLRAGAQKIIERLEKENYETSRIHRSISLPLEIKHEIIMKNKVIHSCREILNDQISTDKSKRHG